MPDDFGDDGGRWASEIAPPHLFFLEEGGPTCNLLEAGLVNAARCLLGSDEREAPALVSEASACCASPPWCRRMRGAARHVDPRDAVRVSTVPPGHTGRQPFQARLPHEPSVRWIDRAL